MAKLLQMPLLFETLLDLQVREIETPQLSQLPQPDVSLVPDAAERDAALDIHRSWIVEAPAGSGKTGLLIQRFLKLLAQGEVEQPSDVLAITFTRKADGEMRRRILEQLSSAQARDPLPASAGFFEVSTRQLAEAALARDQALGWHLLENPQQLNIRTIDSFCAEIAGSMPLIAGAGGRYSPTDDPGPLYELAAERTLLHMGDKDPILTGDLEKLLLLRDAQPMDVRRLLADMLRQREQWGELVPLKTEKLTDQALDEEIRPRLDQTLQRLIGQELAATADMAGPDLLQRLASLGHCLSTCPGYNGEISPIALCEQHPNAPAASADELSHWVCLSKLLLTKDGDWRCGLARNALRFEASRAEQLQLRDLIAAFQVREQSHPDLRKALQQLHELPDGAFPDEQWLAVKALCRVLRQALLELQLVFAERQMCDFPEVALTAKSLIRSETHTNDLLATAVGRLKHLLVDEMQDTSAGQYELLEALTASWDGATQTLFLVGDPKQSIYEFRQARVERFRRVMQDRRFGQLTVDPLRLSANFRSQAALVEAFNTTFSQILPALGDPSLTPDSVDVPFAAATPTRSAATGPALQWHAAEDTLPNAPPPREPAEASNVSTATAYAHEIRGVIETFLTDWPKRPMVPGKSRRPPRIAVLARSRAHLAPVIQKFHEDRGAGPLPFRAVDIEALNERPEILDLLALTRALMSASDRVAWLSVLRSPVCGLSLADLLALTGDGPGADSQATIPFLIATRGQLLSPEGQQLLQRTWSILARAQATLGRCAFSTHLERTWRTLGGDATLQQHENNNARRFLDLLHKLATGPEVFSLSALNRRLRTLYAEPSAPDAPVELMTIHKAKGLEWDLVLIPALHRGSGRKEQEFLKWLEFNSEEGSSEFLLAPIQGKGEKTSRLATWLNRRQGQREEAEAKRLFYVACTRAREELHVFATVARKADGLLRDPRRSDSLLAAAWPAAKPILEQQFRPNTPTSAEVVRFSDPSPYVPLALAAGAEEETESAARASNTPPRLRRLPLSFDPHIRLQEGAAPRWPYPPAESLRTEATFHRPEGSFVARAFGNAVHRFLYLLSTRLAEGQSVADLQAEMPSWHARLQATLRSEGLSPTQATSESARVLTALTSTLLDPNGAWLLSPRTRAHSEAVLPSALSTESAFLRADRTFFAGPDARSGEDATHLWIVDYKTSEPGGRTRDHFLAGERQRYGPQMQAYAEAAIALGNDPDRLVLALYFPLLPALFSWSHEGALRQK